MIKLGEFEKERMGHGGWPLTTFRPSAGGNHAHLQGPLQDLEARITALEPQLVAQLGTPSCARSDCRRFVAAWLSCT